MPADRPVAAPQVIPFSGDVIALLALVETPQPRRDPIAAAHETAAPGQGNNGSRPTSISMGPISGVENPSPNASGAPPENGAPMASAKPPTAEPDASPTATTTPGSSVSNIIYAPSGPGQRRGSRPRAARDASPHRYSFAGNRWEAFRKLGTTTVFTEPLLPIPRDRVSHRRLERAGSEVPRERSGRQHRHGTWTRSGPWGHAPCRRPSAVSPRGENA